MKAYENNKKFLPTCRSLKAVYIRGLISAAIFLLVGTDIAFGVTNKNLCPDGALIYGGLQTKVLVYTHYGKNIRSF